MLDLKGKRNHYHRISSVSKETATGEERYKVDGHLQSMLRKEDLYLDVLPYVFRMIHPNVRDVNTSLFNRDEHMSFKLAIEIMVTLDIKLKRESLMEGNDVAQFTPDITSLVVFGGQDPIEARQFGTAKRKNFAPRT